MATLETTTGDLEIPAQQMQAWTSDIANGSSVAALSAAVPMVFGPGEAFTFDIGEAELVAESGDKAGSTVVPTKQIIAQHKFQKTVRMSQEVLWADEDGRLVIVQQILAKIQPALSRALDYGVYHGINPNTGAPAGSIPTSLSDTTNVITYGGNKPYTYLDAADALVLADGAIPSDFALSPALAAYFAALRGTNSEQKMYPEFRLSTEVSNLDGHRASVSKTVSAVGVASPATGVLGFVGDFSAIQWGIQRNIGLELIEYGDPDGGGDLKRKNQVAFRAEVVYGWGIADLDAFAVIESAGS